jgi:hypothetical protein
VAPGRAPPDASSLDTSAALRDSKARGEQPVPLLGESIGEGPLWWGLRRAVAGFCGALLVSSEDRAFGEF